MIENEKEKIIDEIEISGDIVTIKTINIVSELTSNHRVKIYRNGVSGVSLAKNLRIGDIVVDFNAEKMPHPGV